jgi:hypothetical protein
VSRHKPSAATLRAVAVERRAAMLAGYMIARRFGTPRTERDPYTRDEDRGWDRHHGNLHPRGPAELAGWLAREIWSAS